MIIAVDGPAASGKGTLARRLAVNYGLNYLDTGLIYRAVALDVLRSGRPIDCREAAEEAASTLEPSRFDENELRARGVGEAASIVAAMPEVRRAVLDMQRAFASRSPGAVLDGRDIGTVVCPDADAKLFVTATASERARRRHLEQLGRGERVAYEEVLADIHRRDERDSARSVAPLRAAPDAYLLDTTERDIEAAFQAAVEIVDRHLRKGMRTD